MKTRGQVSKIEYSIIGLLVVSIGLSGVAIFYTSGLSGDISNVQSGLEDIKTQMEEQPKEEQPTEEISGKLAYLSNWTAGLSRDAINAVIDKFTSKYPNVEIAFEGATTASRAAILASRFKAGNPPEAGNLQHGYATLKYAFAGELVPLDNIVEKNNLNEAIPETVMKSCQWNGHTWCLPWTHVWKNMIWYNIHVVEEAGIETPVEFDSWQDFIDACEQIEQNTDKAGFSIGSRGGVQEFRDFWTITVGTQNGFVRAEKLANGEATVDDIMPTLEVFGSLMEYANEGHGGEHPAQTQGHVATGEAAFGLTGQWGYLYMRDKGLMPQEDFWFTSTPNDVFVSHSSTYYVSKAGRNKEAALALGEYMSSKEGQKTWNQIRNQVPARTDVEINTTPVGESGWDPYVPTVKDKISEAINNNKLIRSGYAVIPDQIRSEWQTILTSFTAGDISAQECAQQLIEIQNNNQEAYVMEINMTEGGPVSP